MTRHAARLLGVLAAVLVVLLGASGCMVASSSTATSSATIVARADPGERSGTDPDSGLPYIAEADLPPEAQHTLRLIDSDGPFPYSKDGSRFGNYEGLLPKQSGSYYREYTVDTPGSRDRGARRLIVGEEDEIYWTADHYSSFARVSR